MANVFKLNFGRILTKRLDDSLASSNRNVHGGYVPLASKPRALILPIASAGLTVLIAAALPLFVFQPGMPLPSFMQSEVALDLVNQAPVGMPLGRLAGIIALMILGVSILAMTVRAMRGVFPLPEAQLDRFIVRLSIGYPQPAEEEEILRQRFTDMIMPGIKGRALATTLLPFNPAMKVLYMSGYTDTTILPREMLAEGAAFLQKPFTLSDLARKVREVLDSSGPNPPNP
jgi:CheY-like chemotaxis protein